MNTPWGVSQTVKPCGNDGVLYVETASHGGVYVPNTLLGRIPKDEQAYAAQWSGSANWYEEDCAAAIPIFRLRDCFPQFSDEKAEAYYNSVKRFWNGDRP
jgi:hypothetical protein